VTEYPIEVSGAVSSLSVGEQRVLRRAPFQQHLQTAGFVGESGVKRICSGQGLIFMGHTPVGPFSGTLQTNASGGAGSGGPLSLSCPYTPVGYGGLVAAGFCREDGSGTTNLKLDFTFTPEAGKNYTVKVRSRWGAASSVTGADWTASSRTITKTGAFSSYTYTGDDWVYVSAGGTLGWYKVFGRTSDDAIVLTTDATILSATNLSATLNFTIRSSTDAFFVGNATVSADGLTLTKTGAFSSYTPTADDTIEIISSTGYTASGFSSQPNFVKVASKTDSNSIVVGEALDMAANDTDFGFIVHRRTSFSSASFTGSTATANLTLGSALSFTPRAGDVYYIWEDFVDAGSPELLASNNHEKVATRTAAFSTSSWFPYDSFVKRYPATYSGYTGLSSYPAAPDNSQMNHYWWGLFQTGPEVLSTGSEIILTFNGDITYNGTPYIYEALLIPNFDPDADWVKSLNDGLTRLPTYALWIQSDPITLSGTRDLSVKIGLRSTGSTTFGVTPTATAPPNYGFEVYGQMIYGPLGTSGQNSNSTSYDLTARAVTFSPTALDLTAAPVRWTFLHKFEHPSLRGHPGFHGYYPGEPFSVTTGNGGSLLHQRGTPSTVANLPTAPRARLSRFAVDLYSQGGAR
jgi:hypothetical protein